MSNNTRRNNTRSSAARSGGSRVSSTQGNSPRRSTRTTSAGSRRKKQQEREQQVLKQRLILAGIIALAVIVIIIIWRVAGSAAGSREDNTISSHTSQTETTVTPTPQAEEEIVVIKEPEAADGTADAGIMKLTGERSGSKAGWNEDESGKWYSPEDGTCYFSGWFSLGNDTYHFDENGYAATGWTAIAYRDGRYFTDEGIYVPNVDNSKMICLTFDDGPTEKTGQVLDILAEYDAKATFFVLGVQLEKYGDVINRMAEEGHQIGNHSYSHLDLLEADDQTVIDEFNRTDSLLAAYGVYPEIVRFPYGDYTKEKVALTGRSNILWDNDSLDWDGNDADTVLQNILTYLDGGNIVLMHDMYDATIEMLPQLLEELDKQGYECVTLDEMIASRGYTKRSGVTFLGFKQLNLDQGRVDDT